MIWAHELSKLSSVRERKQSERSDVENLVQCDEFAVITVVQRELAPTRNTGSLKF